MKKKKTIILGIETSCDETAVSVLEHENNKRPKILSNIVSSQFDIHEKFGGVVPELAARSHLEKIDLITNEALKKSKININKIDAIAATAGPGLIVCLSVGLNFAKALSVSLRKPLIAVNHLEGHALSPKLNSELKFPYLLFLISGGHTQFLSVDGLGKYKRLGTTIDDALGEAYDKVSKIMNFTYPGGPIIEQLSKKGNKDRFKLPKPIFYKGGSNMSFAGLKTAVLRLKNSLKTNKDKCDLAASFQKTIIEILIKKTKNAIDEHIENYPSNRSLVVAGGVASNKEIRKNLKKLCNQENFEIFFPNIEICTDNAAMIALVGLEKYKKKKFDSLDFEVKPRWPLDRKAKFLKGAGVKL
ncbi:tRNA (adenosine(37)-N6)-threonylcarbamoyltransferase complex transferase subunit TsaD [Candidatus Pelagibacter communis]|uniref:tRNA (adenosine(37)-N6)-threonylcarbamoyltransferase complex transferase subunit TsaD n=1 Tax=Pelagibacter ubique TaxID=198252 RepID=UPI00094D7992|nr:tRNA (adenosine(37)-N6)-threonylcarbamoyltransferase complex transferase subunit TsaD [Candidatus Pelagibacter ubique]